MDEKCADPNHQKLADPHIFQRMECYVHSRHIGSNTVNSDRAKTTIKT